VSYIPAWAGQHLHSISELLPSALQQTVQTQPASKAQINKDFFDMMNKKHYLKRIFFMSMHVKK
jgi:hypothetical protein